MVMADPSDLGHGKKRQCLLHFKTHIIKIYQKLALTVIQKVWLPKPMYKGIVKYFQISVFGAILPTSGVHRGRLYDRHHAAAGEGE